MGKAIVLVVGSLLTGLLLGLMGCSADLGSTPGTEEDQKCRHLSRRCMFLDGGAPDLASPPDLATAPDLAKPADLAAPPDLTTPPDLATSTCDNAVSTTDTGHHHPGEDCTGCHNGGGGPPQWFVSGTLYDTATGTNPVAGATIHVKDANGQSLALVSAINGNFYTATPVAYPLTVSASRCPSTVKMSGSVQAPGGCNGCHNSTFRVHLP